MTDTTKGSCYLCGGRDAVVLADHLRDHPGRSVLRCAACGLVYLDSFDHIGSDYYASQYTDAHYQDETWQQLLNRYQADDERRAQQMMPLVANRRYLEVGCEAGGVLVRLRPGCAEAAGVEPQTRWREELKRHSISMYPALDEVPRDAFDVVGCFHVLEHVPDPVTFLKELARRVVPGGRIVIEVPNADDALLTLYQSKAFAEFTYCSAHLILYTASTLARLLRKAGLVVDGVTQFQRFPLSNHLVWLTQGKPGGQVQWPFLNSDELSQAYASSLAKAGLCDTLIAHVSRPIE